MKGKAAAVYTGLMATLFILAAPFFAPDGGYRHIAVFKFWLYAGLTGLFLLSLLSRRTGGVLRTGRFSPLELCAAGYLGWSLVSALCSPWRATAFLGGGRQEGFVTLALYVGSFFAVSRGKAPGKGLLWALALGLAALDLSCLLQLGGHDPLGLYPPGLGWADANLLYPGAYLGTVGNAGLTGALLCTLAALCVLAILQRGGHYWLLALPALGAAWVLGRMGVTAAVLALVAALGLGLPAMVRRLAQLWRALGLYPAVLAALFFPYIHGRGWLALGLCLTAAYLLWRFGDPARNVTSWCWAMFLAGLAVLAVYVYTYRGWRLPLREAAALLHGQASPDFGGGRLYIWSQVLETAKARPLLGGGPDTLGLRGLAPYVWLSAETGKQVTNSIDAAHCEYLQTLVNQGVPAALFHLALPLLGLWRFVKAGDRPSAPLYGAAVCYGVQALFGISHCAAAPVFWLLLGCGQCFDYKGTSD